MTDTLSLMAADLDEMKTDLDTVRTHLESILALENDGALGTAVYGVNASDITTTTPVEVLPAAGAGFKYRIRRIKITNKTAAETAVITVQDDGVPAVLYVGVAGDPAVSMPEDTGWMKMPIETLENVAVDGVAGTTTGDTRVMIWADKVAV